jgi:ferredoxin-thioredoxin reductase catalytic subunit
MPKHYLLTIDVRHHAHMHGYVMCNDRRDLIGVLNRMLDKAEAIGLTPLPVILSTELTTGCELVRKIVCARSAEAKQHIETATDFHFSAWIMPTEDPDDRRLMELH